MNKDQIIFSLIEKEKNRQINGIELIASENYVSDQVLSVAGSCLTNKYAEGYPNKRYYGGCQYVDQIEQIAIDRAKKIFGIEYANVQPHSGSQANFAVFSACLNPGDKILGFDLSHGGHLTHGSSVNFSGKLYDPYFYGVSKENGLIDYDEMERAAKNQKPKMIICGASAYSRDWDYSRFRKVADEIGAILLADISHPAGLISKGLLNNPFDYCHIVTSTTHKTLRGPRGGIIMIGKDFENPFGKKTKKGDLKMMSTLINSSVFPGCQGGPLEHLIGAKAVAFSEIMDDKFSDYINQVKKNASVMAKSLISLGYNIISSGTDNHCILIDLRSKNITGKDAEYALGLADITVNKNMVPFDDKSPFITSGIRIGTPAITTRGLTENHIPLIAELLDRALSTEEDSDSFKKIKAEVNELMTPFPLYK